MKNPFLPLLAACLLVAGTAAAQATTPATPDAASTQSRPYGRMQGSADEMAKRQSERMTRELGLSADQSAKTQEILMARSQEMQAMRGQTRDGRTRGQMREQMEAGRIKYDAQFKALLTADQYTKYTAMQSDRMDRRDDMENGNKMKAKNGKMKMKKADK